MFKVGDIKIGYLLAMETKDRERYYVTVVPYRVEASAYDLGCCGCCNNHREFFTLAALDKNLTLRSSSGVDSKVMSVYGIGPLNKALDNSPEGRQLYWVRQEVKKMTVAEIEEKLGYPIEIISDSKEHT